MWVDDGSARRNGFKLKEGRFRLGNGEVLYQESGRVLEQAAQSSCGCPIPGGFQCQNGWALGSLVWY